MAGLAAGVVTAGDVSSQPPLTNTKMQAPATWAYIWTGVATAYLIGIYFGMIHVTRVEA